MLFGALLSIKGSSSLTGKLLSLDTSIGAETGASSLITADSCLGVIGSDCCVGAGEVTSVLVDPAVTLLFERDSLLSFFFDLQIQINLLQRYY